MITLYTKPACVQCEQTKKLMNKLNIEYSIIDMTEDPATLEMLISKGFRSAPVVITDNDSWGGFNPEKINSLAKDS
jgi:glutaredoxin-like protein NrdH